MSQNINIAYEDLQSLVAEGKNIVASPKAEEALVALLTLKEEVENAIEEAKKVIEEKALELNPNFSSIRSDKIKVAYKTYGAKYAIDETKVNFLPKEVYRSKVSYTADAKALEKFVEEHGGLFPDGIIIKDRKKSMSISLIGEKEYDGE
jgi:hypothetical protein